MRLPEEPQTCTVTGTKTLSATPRHQLVLSSPEEQVAEIERVGKLLREVMVSFRTDNVEITASALTDFQTIAQVLRTYPEMPVKLESFTPRTGLLRDAEEKHLQHLSQDRATRVRKALLDLGVVNDMSIEGLGSRGAGQKVGGFVVLLAQSDIPLLSCQQRLDLIFERCFFEFVPSTDNFTPKGELVAGMVAAVLMESSKKVIITCPKRSSELALRRADVIVKALYAKGVEVEILVKVAVGDQQLVTVAIDGSQPDVDPQRALSEILKENPFAFKENASDVMPDALKILSQAAEVLKEVKYQSLVIEAYSGVQNEMLTEQKAADIMLERSQSIKKHLYSLGVKLSIITRGYAGPYTADGGTDMGPRVFLTLLSPGEEEELGMSDGLQELLALPPVPPPALGYPVQGTDLLEPLRSIENNVESAEQEGKMGNGELTAPKELEMEIAEVQGSPGGICGTNDGLFRNCG